MAVRAAAGGARWLQAGPPPAPGPRIKIFEIHFYRDEKIVHTRGRGDGFYDLT